jgi:hypothetical protein
MPVAASKPNVRHTTAAAPRRQSPAGGARRRSGCVAGDGPDASNMAPILSRRPAIADPTRAVPGDPPPLERVAWPLAAISASFGPRHWPCHFNASYRRSRSQPEQSSAGLTSDRHRVCRARWRAETSVRSRTLGRPGSVEKRSCGRLAAVPAAEIGDEQTRSAGPPIQQGGGSSDRRRQAGQGMAPRAPAPLSACGGPPAGRRPGSRSRQPGL